MYCREGTGVIGGFLCSRTPCYFRDDDAIPPYRSIRTDEEFLAKSKEPPEVQAFLTKYPNVTTSIERGSDVFVKHSISKSVHEGKPIDPSNVIAARHDSYLYIWVIMGEKSLQIYQISLLCSGGDVIYDPHSTGWTREHYFQINENIISYLQEDKEKICFE